MISEQLKTLDRDRFARALTDARARQSVGIGTLSEKLLHATLKNYFTCEGDLQERKVDGSIADIYGACGLVEIQTCGCHPLKDKLTRLAARGEDITVVCPIMRRRTLFWMDPETAELSGGRKSPKKGRYSDMLPELFYFSALLEKENFAVLLFLYDGEEYKVKKGLLSGRKRVQRIERVPTEAVDILEISSGYDLGALLPENCPECFTAETFSKMTGHTRRRLWAALKLLEAQGIVTREKVGRGYLYTVVTKEFLKK